MNCPKCSQHLPNEARFCFACGEPTQLVFCSSCQARLPGEAKFCLSCGQVVAGNGNDSARKTDVVLGYCAGNGSAIRASDVHFKCMSCGNLYTEKFRFQGHPVCESCVSASGLTDVLEQEKGMREATLTALFDSLAAGFALLRQERQAERAGGLAKVAEIRYGAIPKWVESFQQLQQALHPVDQTLFSDCHSDFNANDYNDQPWVQELRKKEERKFREEAEAKQKPHICPVTGMEFVIVPEGEFQMGDVWGDGDDGEKPTRLVTVPAFQMAKYPVTQGQWLQVMGGENPAAFSGDTFVHPDKPIIHVSWDDAREFIQRLNRKSGCKYRLPSEAEWEYAARSGGSRDKYSGTSNKSSLSAYAWFTDNSDGRLHKVGQKLPNDLELYDMSGNVWEWCEDCWHNNYEGAPTDGSAWTSGADSSVRVFRGGSWVSSSSDCRVAYRSRLDRGIRDLDLGFRLSQDSR